MGYKGARETTTHYQRDMHEGLALGQRRGVLLERRAWFSFGRNVSTVRMIQLPNVNFPYSNKNVKNEMSNMTR